METSDPDYVALNRRAWETWAPEFAAWAPDAWADGAITWGIFAAPDAEADTPATEHLERPYFGLHRLNWADASVSFNLGYGDWIRVLRANDFIIDDVIEVRPTAGATTSSPIVTPEWARQWPCEEIWKAHKG